MVMTHGCTSLSASWWRMSQTFAIVSVSALAAAVVATLLRRCPCSCLKSRTARILQALALCGTGEQDLDCSDYDEERFRHDRYFVRGITGGSPHKAATL